MFNGGKADALNVVLVEELALMLPEPVAEPVALRLSAPLGNVLGGACDGLSVIA